MAQPLLALYELDRVLSRAEVVSALARIPQQIADALAQAGPERLTAPGPDGGWSPLKVLLHMRDAALVYSIRFRWMVFDDEPSLPNYDENRWVEACRDEAGDVEAILNEVAALREGLVRLLSRLPEDGWARRGRHEVLGPVGLEPYVRHQLAHEEAHLAQLRSAAGC
jgi:DinB superfamily